MKTPDPSKPAKSGILDPPAQEKMNPVEEVKARLDIIDVISKHVELRRAGRNYKALCPFHSEKTPSFVVFPDTQTWRCFGACAEGGDVYSFLMKKNGWDFGETLRNLAEQTGVELKPRTPEQIERQEMNLRLYELLNTATLFYMHQLRNSPAAEHARQYVAQRAIQPDTAERFQLGYAPDQWDAAQTFLNSKGYTDDELLAVGLLVEREESGRRYDRFRNRLLIPIRDLRGRVVGFGARALEPDAIPKYLNSPQTELFDKSTLLYGLDMAKKGVREAGQAIIVEGYMDVIQGHQVGHNNMIAQMGTALTEAQLRQLKRYTSRIILALDADAAGQKATLRGLNVARQTLDREVEVIFDPRGLARHESRLQADIRVATLPAGFDPDKLIREEPAAWAQLVAGARPVVEYIIDAIITGLDLSDAKAKSSAVARAMPIIRDVTNVVERNHYTQHLARRLSIDERTLVSMATLSVGRAPSRLQKRSRFAPPPPPAPPDGESSGAAGKTRPRATSSPQEMHCLNQIIRAPGAWQQVNQTLENSELSPISSKDFTDPQNRAIFVALQELGSDEKLDEKLDESLRTRLRDIQAERKDLIPPSEKIANHLAYTVLLMRKDAARQSKRELDSAWAEALSEADRAAIGLYGQQVLELEGLRLKIDKALGLINNPLTGNHNG